MVATGNRLIIGGNMEQRYDNILAAAYVRGAAIQGKVRVSDELLHKKIHSLEPSELERLIEAGSRAGLKMYRFKNHEELPRVKSALGILRGLQPETLLDVGSGRGVFLFPFLKAFPDVQVTSVDLLIHRVEFLKNLHDGGIENLTALQQDICCWDMADHSFDIVLLFGPLYHLKNNADKMRCINEAKRVCRDDGKIFFAIDSYLRVFFLFLKEKERKRSKNLAGLSLFALI